MTSPIYIADNTNHRIQKLEGPGTDNPTITITTPTNNATITNGATLTAAFTCTDTDSGIDTCTATLNGVNINNGATIPTTTAGSRALIVTATDNAGNTASTTTNFTIKPAPPKYGPREIIGTHAKTSGNNGAIARLYMATFTRQPDNAGHTYWANQTTAGVSLTDVAYHFVNSAEFKTTYNNLNNLNNQQFIELLYINVMNRTGDTPGVNYWTSVLNAGTSRARILVLFSESAEFKVLTKTS